jgi:hypothetical protein
MKISDPIMGNLERMLLWELDVYSCFKEACSFDHLQTQLVLSKWFPQQGDWDLFFSTIYLLKSTSQYFSKDNIPITFRGFTLEDAKALLQIGFQPPASCVSSGQWDNPKKQLAQHLVTKMDQMRKDHP